MQGVRRLVGVLSLWLWLLLSLCAQRSLAARGEQCSAAAWGSSNVTCSRGDYCVPASIPCGELKCASLPHGFHGFEETLGGVAGAMASREVRILVLGGSVTVGLCCDSTSGCGGTPMTTVPKAVPRGFAGHTEKCRWSTQLAEQLVARTRKRHAVVNKAQHGTSTSYGGSLLSSGAAEGFDLVIVDYDVNDAGLPAEELQFWTERLIRAARSSPGHPAVLFLHMLFDAKQALVETRNNRTLETDHALSIQRIKQPVLDYYGVPSVSYVDFAFDRWRSDRGSKKSYFYSGTVHPPWSVHSLAASLVAERLASAAAGCDRGARSDSDATEEAAAAVAPLPGRNVLPAWRFRGGRSVCAARGTFLTSVGCNYIGCLADILRHFGSTSTKKGAWHFSRYLNQKDYGWINGPGLDKDGKEVKKGAKGAKDSALTFKLDRCFDLEEEKTHTSVVPGTTQQQIFSQSRNTTLRVGLLRSYEGMGRVAVDARVADDDGATPPPPWVQLAVIDATWEARASLYEEVSLGNLERSDAPHPVVEVRFTTLDDRRFKIMSLACCGASS